MADVTQDMILEYILRKGGIVKNVDLVRHFKKHLQVEDPTQKDRAREAFKERVNSVAYIKAERGEKYLHLRPEFEFKLTQPLPSKTPNGQRSSVVSSGDPLSPRHSVLNTRDSFFNDYTSSVTTSPSRTIINSKETVSNNIAGIPSQKNSAVLSSYKPINTSYDPPDSSKPAVSNSIFSPPSMSNTKSSMSFDLGGSDFGSSIFAELDTIGSLLGNSTGSSLLTGGSGAQPTSSITNTTPKTSSNIESYLSPSRKSYLSSSKTEGSSSSLNPGYSSQQTSAAGSSTSNSPFSTPSHTASGSNSTTNQSNSSLVGQSYQSVQSKNPSQTTDRASSGYGSLDKASSSSQSAVTSSTAVQSTTQSSKSTTGSLFDDIESMFSGLDSSISMSLLSDTSSKPSSVTGTSVSNKSTGPSVTSPPSGSNIGSRPNSATGGTLAKTSTLNSGMGTSYNSPSHNPMRESVKSNSSLSSMDSSRPSSSIALAPTNGNSDVKHVTSRRPPPAPSPATKRPAPKPPIRKSSEKSNSLGRSTTNNIGGDPYNKNTQSLGRHSYTPTVGGMANGVGGSRGGLADDPTRQSLGSFGLDFLTSLPSFSAPAGSSLDDGPPLPPPSQVSRSSRTSPPSQLTQASRASPSRASPPSQLPPPSHRHSRSSDSGRPRGPVDDAPFIRVESPTKSSDTSSFTGRVSPLSITDSGRGRSPGSSLGLRPYNESAERLGQKSQDESNDRIPPGVVLRRAPSHSSGNRRSRNFDKNSNLENKTRQMIVGTPPNSRRSQHLAPPEVAPKPATGSNEIPPARSREDVTVSQYGSQYGDEEGSGSIVGTSEPDYWDIDPYEKEWMLANAEANMETIHRLFMTEPSLVNRKDFLHGYTAMHWAAKHGRCDLISALHMNGAMADLKSGQTPLHLAAASGHDNAIQFLVQECRANINARDHGGRRPVDVLNAKCQQKTKVLLSRIDNHGLPIPKMHWVNELSSFSRPRSTVNLSRTWSSVGDITKQHGADAVRKRHSPKSIRKSFSFKKTRIRSMEPASPSKEKKEKKRKANKRPFSYANAYDV